MNKKLTKKQIEIYNWLLSKPGYLKKSADIICMISNLYGSLDDHEKALKQAKLDFKSKRVKFVEPTLGVKGVTINTSRAIKWSKVSKVQYPTLQIKKNPFDINNVIFIPDLHSPFIKEGVLDWILDEQKKYNAGTVIFAGDIIDGHAWSYHEHDVDGMSVGDELDAAKKQLREWYKAFPQAISLLGNHDLLIQRKAKTAGLSKHFIKDFGSIIDAPKAWEFKYEHILNNVLYHHGSIGDAFKVAKDRRISTCQGHLHSKTFVQWSVSDVDAIFGLQVGWGADRDKYAFDYGKSFVTKPVLSCGLILDKGQTPIVKLMKL